MQYLKKLIMIFIAVVVTLFIALLITEILLSVFDINKKQVHINSNFNRLDFKRFIQIAYIDIYKPFFKIKNGYFSIQRKNIWDENDTRFGEEYRVKKQKNQKRVFIVGESTAEMYGKGVLVEELSKYFSVEVINCGMGAYDSYRIERVTRELNKFNPDWIIFLMGNNVEQRNFFTPIMINPLPYKYKIIDRIRVLNILSNLLYPNTLMIFDKEKKENFCKYVKKILDNLKGNNIIFVDLPNNEEREYKKNDARLDIKTLDNNKQILFRNTKTYNNFLLRIEFLKKMANNKDIFVTNLTEELRNYTDNKLGYNIFYDDCHFTTGTYKLLSQLITKIIVRKELNKTIDISIDKNKFYELLKYDHSFVYRSAFNDFGIKNCYKSIYADFINRYNDFKNGNSQDYLTLVLFLKSLYKMMPEKNEEIKIMLKELTESRLSSYEAPLLLGYIYFCEKNYKKFNEYLNIAKMLEPDNIDVKYLSEKINETKNSCN